MPAMQPPTVVPGKGPESITADCTEPSGLKVTVTCPDPVGPSDFLHEETLIPPSEAAAAPRSNGAVEADAPVGALVGFLPAASSIALWRSFGWVGVGGGVGGAGV